MNKMKNELFSVAHLDKKTIKTHVTCKFKIYSKLSVYMTQRYN